MLDAALPIVRRPVVLLGRVPVIPRAIGVVMVVCAAFLPLVIRIASASRPDGHAHDDATGAVALLSALLLGGTLALNLGLLWPCERWRRNPEVRRRRELLPAAVRAFRRAPVLLVGGMGMLWAVYAWALERVLEHGVAAVSWTFTGADLADLGARTLASVALLPMIDWLLSPFAAELGQALRDEGLRPGQIGPGVSTLLLAYTASMVLSPWLTLLQFHLRGVLDWPHVVAYFPGFVLWLALAIAGLSRFMIAPLRAALRVMDNVIGADGTIRSERMPPVTAAEFDEWSSAVNRMLDRLVGVQGELQLRIAERDQRTLEANQALQLRDEFMDIASHELRTPLTALLLQLKILESRDPQLATVTHRAARNARRLGVLVDALLDASRIRAGVLELVRRPEPMGALLTDVLGEGSGMTLGPLVVQCEAGLVVELDRDRMEQVLLNLVGNARKYGPPEAPIRVSVVRLEDDALLMVSDQGPGVAEEDREVIFDRFVRGAPAVRSSHVGLGLGLYICKTIVDRHGGRIWVESGEEGKGARFCVRLPGAHVASEAH